VTFSYIRNNLPEAYRVISWFVPPHLLSLDSHIVGFDFINVAVNCDCGRQAMMKGN
jgi:hypothetical protein